MVGVPGKSKGCSTCRRRKKGCDQGRPFCQNCISAGYKCGGYQRDLTFIIHPTTKTIEKEVFLPVRPAPPLLTLLPSLDRTAVSSQCRHLFYDIFMPHGRAKCVDPFILQFGGPMNWTELVPKFDTEEMSLELAFSALSISRVGRSNNDTRLVNESSRLYGKALKSLHGALVNPKRMFTEEVLAATQLLGLYEAFEGVTGKAAGWVSHTQGAARLMQLRGPEAHGSLLAHHLFLGSRPVIVYAAIMRRKRTFLGDPEWLTLPWGSLHRTGRDLVIDMMTKVPGVLEEFDTIRSNIPCATSIQSLLACLAKCRGLQKGLTMWIDNVRKPNAIPTITKHENTGNDDTYPFPYDVTYENHCFLESNLVYLSASLVVAMTIEDITLLLASLGFYETEMLQTAVMAQREGRDFATMIGQAILFALWPDNGDLGINNITCPMSIAYQFFSRVKDTAVCSWFVKICDSKKHTGLRIENFDNGSTSIGAVDDLNQEPLNDEDLSNPNLRECAEYGVDVILHSHNLCPGLDPSGRRPRRPPHGSAYPDCGGREVAGGPVGMENHPHHTQGRSRNGSVATLEDYSRRGSEAISSDTGGDHDSDHNAGSPESWFSNDSASSIFKRDIPGVSKELLQLQMINASKGDYTFVTEDPSAHYSAETK